MSDDTTTTEVGGPEADTELDQLRDKLTEAESAVEEMRAERDDVKGQLADAEAEVEKLKKAKPKGGNSKKLPEDVQRALRMYATPTRNSSPRTAQGLCLKYDIPKIFD